MPKSLILSAAVVLFAPILVAGPLGGAAAAGPPDMAEGVRPLPVDVLVLSGASLVEPDEDTKPDAQLYNASGLSLADPLGEALTWGRWSAATATSRAATIGGPEGRRTDVRLSMQGLVPLGVYSIFWATLGPDSVQPLCPNVERLLPLDALKPDVAAPDLNSFIADATGTAEFRGRVNGDLLAAEQLFFNVVFHADGRTYYPFPNRGEFETQGENCRSSFGIDAMRHLYILQTLPLGG